MTQPRSIHAKLSIAGAIVAIAVATLAAPVVAVPQTQTAADEATLYSSSGAESSFTAIVASTNALSDAEIADILFMREEEKLAQDVYLALSELWGSRIFTNIAAAESMHMSSVETLIDRYGLDDPVDNNPAGVFVDPTLQAMYEDLVATGSQSLTAAFGVGALIEEVDIEDLLESIERTTSPDVAVVWQQLLSGSQNHLRAFTSQLAAQGVAYEPTVLNAVVYEQMLSEAGQGKGAGARSVGGHGGGSEASHQGGRGHGQNS